MERLTDSTEYCTSWSDCEMPEECVFLQNCYDRKIYNRLREYEDAEEQGVLIRLPFSAGTRVYEIVEDCTNDFSCIHHEYEDERDCKKCQYLKQRVYERHYMSKEVIVYNMYKFGKTVFLTREEAEAALAEMEKRYEGNFGEKI